MQVPEDRRLFTSEEQNRDYYRPRRIVVLLKVAVKEGLIRGERVVSACRMGIRRNNSCTRAAEDKGAIRCLYDIEKVEVSKHL